MALKRYNVKHLYSCPERRRLLIARSTVATQAREGVDITLDEALASYDQLEASGELERVRMAARRWPA